MLEKILVPLDGSPRAEAILTQLRRLLGRKDAEVVLVRVVEPPSTMNAREYAQLLDARRAEARTYLDVLVKNLVAAGVRAGARVYEGYPAEAILEAAKAAGASLVAMSTHGRSGIDRWSFGSVTEKVIRASEVPLLVVRSFRKDPSDRPKEVPVAESAYRRILLPIDASDLSLAAVAPAKEMAMLFNAEVLLVHVVEGAIAYGVPLPQIERAQEILLETAVRVEVLVRHGDPASEILSTSKERAADLIVLASHGRTGLPRWFLGSVAEKVLRTADVPVLVVRVKP